MPRVRQLAVLRDTVRMRWGRSSFRRYIAPELRAPAFDRHPSDSLCVEAHR